MLVYRCAHCGEILGEVVDGVPQPACPTHPDGVVEAHENGDPQPQ